MQQWLREPEFYTFSQLYSIPLGEEALDSLLLDLLLAICDIKKNLAGLYY